MHVVEQAATLFPVFRQALVQFNCYPMNELAGTKHNHSFVMGHQIILTNPSLNNIHAADVHLHDVLLCWWAGKE